MPICRGGSIGSCQSWVLKISINGHIIYLPQSQNANCIKGNVLTSLDNQYNGSVDKISKTLKIKNNSSDNKEASTNSPSFPRSKESNQLVKCKTTKHIFPLLNPISAI